MALKARESIRNGNKTLPGRGNPMSDYLKAKRVNEPVITAIAGKYRNASLIGEKLFQRVTVVKRRGQGANLW